MPLETIIDYQTKCLQNNKPIDFAMFFKVSTALIEYDSRDLELCRMNKELNHKLSVERAKTRRLELEASKLRAEVEEADRIILELEGQNNNLKKNLSL
jgi:hypothetical protein